MKKILLFLLLALPFTGNAQDLKKPAKQNGLEFGLNTGLAFNYNIHSNKFFSEGRHALSFYKNFKLSQIGASFEFGTNGGSELSFSTNAIVNKTIHFKKMYLYGGGAAGYKHIQRNREIYGSDYEPRTGYQLGLLAGIVQHLGRHLSFNAELAMRSEQIWYTRTENVETYEPLWSHFTVEIRDSYFELYYPVTIGIRYRF